MGITISSTGKHADHVDLSWIAGKGVNQDIYFEKVATPTQVKHTHLHEQAILLLGIRPIKMQVCVYQKIPGKTSGKDGRLGAGEIAQLVNSLLHKHEDLS